jgi:hypothetical protein
MSDTNNGNGNGNGNGSYHHAKLTDPDLIREFCLAGNSYFTLVSTKTQVRFTYRMNKTEPDANGKEGKVSHFVALLTEPDNTHSYKYLGHIFRADGKYWHGNKSKIHQGAPGAQGFIWFYEKVIQQGKRPTDLGLEFWHEGRCGKCGRKLTVPESIERGIGPECASRMGR